MSNETTDERRSDEDRKMGCGHGVRWTMPCTTCNRTESDIKLTAFVDDVVERLIKLSTQWTKMHKNEGAGVIDDIACTIADARIKTFGKGGG